MAGLTVITGGARSGKSTLALRLAQRAEPRAVVFVATCPRIPGDDELAERISVHREERPPHWHTIEAEHDLAGALSDIGALSGIDPEAMAIIDCLTLWVSNLLFRGDDVGSIDAACAQALELIAARPGPTVVVTNEVGFGIVPADEATRTYRDVLGRVNQAWVAAADQSLFVVAGKALPLSDPFELLDGQ